MSRKMSNPWFRLYTDIIDDEKLGLVAFEDRWHFTALLACKARGLLDKDESAELMRRKVALKLGLATRELDEVARRLAEVGLIERDTLQPHGWDERQFVSDSSTDRVRAYRERTGKRTGNADETFQKRPKNTDTETDTETEEEKKGKEKSPEFGPAEIELPDRVTRQAWVGWIKYRRDRKLTIREQTLRAQLEKLDEWSKAGHDPNAIIQDSITNGWQGLFEPKGGPRRAQSTHAGLESRTYGNSDF